MIRRVLSRLLIVAPLACAHLHAADLATSADVVIYGGTPSGLAAATAVVREGATAIVVEPNSHIGGMISGGIAITDTLTPHFVGGISAEFFDEAAAENRRNYPDAKEPILLFRGKQLPLRKPRLWDLEPKTATCIFDRWVRQAGFQVVVGQRVTEVNKNGAQIVSITISNGMRLVGKIFVDASYEGDLMAKAGVSYTYGRESRDQYGEKMAGVRGPHFVRNYTPEEYATPSGVYMHHGQFGSEISAFDEFGKRLWGVEETPAEPIGSADKRVQAYCFRLIATQRPDLKVAWPKPDQYDSSRYELLLRYVQAHPGITFTRLVHLAPIPNGKFDLNASGPCSIDYVGGNQGYPDAEYAARDRMLRDHEDYEKGFLWFLAHDRRVPADLQEEVNSWGLAKDEWLDSGNWPTQLYIRESRRLIGAYVVTEDDILRNVGKDDSIGLGSFVLDSHWVRRFVNPSGFVRVEGHLDESINLAARPYEIPYRSITPAARECTNLLVTVCLSATHVAICTIRMEPVYMILGHSAGVAAVISLKSGKAVQEIDQAVLAKRLIEQKQILHKEQRKK